MEHKDGFKDNETDIQPWLGVIWKQWNKDAIIWLLYNIDSLGSLSSLGDRSV